MNIFEEKRREKAKTITVRIDYSIYDMFKPTADGHYKDLYRFRIVDYNGKGANSS